MEPWRILVVEDQKEIAEQTAELIRTDPTRRADSPVAVHVETRFDAALDLAESARIDLIILDVRDQGVADSAPFDDMANPDGSDTTEADKGLAIFASIRGRRFAPVIFYTALPNLVDSRLIRPPFVQVLSKNDNESTSKLRAAVSSVLGSTLPAIHRALNDHIEAIIRDFMTDFVEPRWSELEAPARKGDLAHLLLRRLALSLADGGEILASRLADSSGVELQEDHVHPMRFYVMPPVGDPTTGDIVVGLAPQGPGSIDSKDAERDDLAAANPVEETSRNAVDGKASGEKTWYVVLTPACDLVRSHLKADFVVLAECVPLKETPEYARWLETRPAGAEAPSDDAKKAMSALDGLMHNRRSKRPADRDYFLPAAWAVPDLVVDFQRISSIPVAKLESSYERVATLDSPYVDALVETFSRYLGRRGTPDLDVKLSIEHLQD